MYSAFSLEHLGASHWYPCKDHLSDEPDSAYLQWEAPKKFDCFSNGKLQSVETLENGYLRHNWFVQNPIDTHNIAFYLGHYQTKELEYISPLDSAEHTIRLYTLDYEPESHINYTFAHVTDMLYFYEMAFGAYPYWNDGLSLIQSPHRGMEHQGCLAIGKHLSKGNGSYVTVVAHEIAHEWWGNSVSVADMADAWLQEGFATYSEMLFHEYLYGNTAYNKYVARISNRKSGGVGIIGKRDVNANTFKNNDIYYKGAMVLHNLRLEIDDTNLFFQVLRVFQLKFKNKTVDTNDFIETVNLITQKDYRPFLMGQLNR